MKTHILRDREGLVIGTFQAEEAQSPEGTIAVEPEIEDGQDIETIELRRSETFDLDALHKRLARKKK